MGTLARYPLPDIIHALHAQCLLPYYQSSRILFGLHKTVVYNKLWLRLVGMEQMQEVSKPNTCQNALYPDQERCCFVVQ